LPAWLRAIEQPINYNFVYFIIFVLFCVLLLFILRYFFHNYAKKFTKESCITSGWAYELETLEPWQGFVFHRKEFADDYAAMNGEKVYEIERNS